MGYEWALTSKSLISILKCMGLDRFHLFTVMAVVPRGLLYTVGGWMSKNTLFTSEADFVGSMFFPCLFSTP